MHIYMYINLFFFFFEIIHSLLFLMVGQVMSHLIKSLKCLLQCFPNVLIFVILSLSVSLSFHCLYYHSDQMSQASRIAL